LRKLPFELFGEDAIAMDGKTNKLELVAGIRAPLNNIESLSSNRARSSEYDNTLQLLPPIPLLLEIEQMKSIRKCNKKGCTKI